MAVGAGFEASNAAGIKVDQFDNSSNIAGAAYVFRYDGTDWSQRSYVKASNPGRINEFGFAISLSADGNTLAVGAIGEESHATGFGVGKTENSADASGAVYLY